MMTDQILLVTDGACRANPGGPGSWAVLRRCSSNPALDDDFSGAEASTTNNQMELRAVLEGLSRCPVGSHVTVQTDSQNVVGWLEKRFRRSAEPICRLCDHIDAIIAERSLTVIFEKVLGHSGHPLNEQADALATATLNREYPRPPRPTPPLPRS